MQWIQHNKLIFAVIVLLVAFGVWYGLSQSAEPAPLLTTTSDTGSPTVDSADQQLVTTLLALRAVTLNGSIFSDPAFMSLQDYSTTIIAEPIGRENPFAPLRSTATSTTENPHAAQLFAPKK